MKRGRRKKRPDGSLMMEIATPVCGYKRHIGADRRYRFVRAWPVTDAAAHEGREPGGLLDRSSAASPVRADTACRSRKTEKTITKAGLISKVHFRKPPGRPMPEAKRRANSARSTPRSGVEHLLADQKHRMRLFIGTIAIARARTKIGMANIAHNLRRDVFCKTNGVAG